MSKEKVKNEDLNYHYINTELELVKGVPASVLIVWAIPLIFMNIYAIIIATLLSLLIIVLYRGGYTIIEMVSIVKYALRDQRIKLFTEEEKYDKNI